LALNSPAGMLRIWRTSVYDYGHYTIVIFVRCGGALVTPDPVSTSSRRSFISFFADKRVFLFCDTVRRLPRSGIG
jgi:hypothetical protein